jgi:hypothetical protein
MLDAQQYATQLGVTFSPEKRAAQVQAGNVFDTAAPRLYAPFHE